MAVPWIKLNTSIFDDEKIKLIDAMPEHDAILVVWIKLLTLAGKCNASGCLMISDSMPYTDEMLSAIFNRPLQIIRLALEAFERLGMIERHDRIMLVNWEKHQNEAALATIREHDAERKRLQRSKILECPGHVPDKSRNVRILELDIDRELDKDREHTQEARAPEPSSDPPKYLRVLYDTWMGCPGLPRLQDFLGFSLSDHARRALTAVRGTHSDDVLAAIKNYGEIADHPRDYWPKMRPSIAAFFEGELFLKCLPQNFPKSCYHDDKVKADEWSAARAELKRIAEEK